MTVDQIDVHSLKSYLEDAVARYRAPGMSVAVLRNGSEVITAAAGITNVTTGVALTEDTVMHIGSITKVLNATLVMQLVDNGKVGLDERVATYLPDLRLKDSAALEHLTVKMLLNHTSGIDGAWLPDRGHDEETIEKTVAQCANLGQLFPPGTDLSYNNVAAVIAGYLAQRVTGKSWYCLIKERIFEPLGMEHAATLPEEAMLHRASVGHFLRPGPSEQWIRTSNAFLGLGFAPAGSTLMMSASNLMAFAQAHIALGRGQTGARILSVESAMAMRQPLVNKGGSTTGESAGLGWAVSNDGLLSHAGGGPGIYAFLCVHAARGFAVAFLANAAEPRTLCMIHGLVEPWFRELGASGLLWWARDPAPAEVASIDMSRYTGVYEDVMFRWHVVSMGDGLAIYKQQKIIGYDTDTTEPDPPVQLLPLGGDRFLMEATNEFNARYTAGRRVAFRDLDEAGVPRLVAISSSLARRH